VIEVTVDAGSGYVDCVAVNWLIKNGVNPLACTCAISAGVGPNVDCSKNRTAAAEVAAIAAVTCTEADVVDPAPPGFGLFTVTEILPTCEAVAVPVAVSCVDETNVVVIATPPNITCDPFTNPLPVTVSENAPTETAFGLTLETAGSGFINVIALVPDEEALATLTAETVTKFWVGTTVGAKKFPEPSIVPIEEFPPVILFTCHVTEVFVVPVTVAVNTCVLPALTLDEAGATATLITGGGVVPTPAPPHPHTDSNAAKVPASAHGILRFITATPVQYLCKPSCLIKVLHFLIYFRKILSAGIFITILSLVRA
jgi:hypothetical protein